jgi:hypothetical protein
MTRRRIAAPPNVEHDPASLGDRQEKLELGEKFAPAPLLLLDEVGIL